MLKIGLTGGIGCGKTTVAQLFASLGVPVIDADAIAHGLVQPGQPALGEIRQIWGEGILNGDGSLNRGRLRAIVFADTMAKQKLEGILHPLVLLTMQTALKALAAPYCVLCIPLLFEANMTHLADRVLVIDCPEETQVSRVKARDRLPAAQIQAIMASQVSRAYRIAHADDLLENMESNDKLAEQVKKLHNLYLSISDCRD